MLRLLRTFLEALVAIGPLIALPVPANAQTCASRFSFSYLGGDKGCISDLSIAKDGVVGFSTSLEQTIPPTGMYSVATAPRSEACPAVIGMVVLRKYLSGPMTAQARDAPSERAKAAISDCQNRVDATKPQGSSCQCKLILEDGTSPMSRLTLESFLALSVAAPK